MVQWLTNIYLAENIKQGSQVFVVSLPSMHIPIA